MPDPNNFACYLVERDAQGNVSSGIARRSRSDLPPGDVLVHVHYSSLNYKDALAVRGHKGVVGSFPHVPGIDAAGVVAESSSPAARPGDEVIVTGHDLGAGVWGGYSQYIHVPSTWIVPRPDGLSLFEAMALGTAGFTAAQCVMAIERRVAAGNGEVVVTGATGGVGSLAVALLAKLGYQVVASTGKADAARLLAELGATRIIARTDVDDRTDRPLLTNQ